MWDADRDGFGFFDYVNIAGNTTVYWFGTYTATARALAEELIGQLEPAARQGRSHAPRRTRADLVQDEDLAHQPGC